MAARSTSRRPHGDPVRLAALRGLARPAADARHRPDRRPRVHRRGGSRSAGRYALISESLWHGASPGAPPRRSAASIRLDERPHTIVGVVPDASDFGMLQILSAGRLLARLRGSRRGARASTSGCRCTPIRGAAARAPSDLHARPAGAGPDAGMRRSTSFAAIAAALEARVSREPRPRRLRRTARRRRLRAGAADVVSCSLARSASSCCRVRERRQPAASRAGPRTGAGGRGARALGATPARVARQFLDGGIGALVGRGVIGVALAFAGVRAARGQRAADVPRLMQRHDRSAGALGHAGGLARRGTALRPRAGAAGARHRPAVHAQRRRRARRRGGRPRRRCDRRWSPASSRWPSCSWPAPVC